MTQDEILETAREAGGSDVGGHGWTTWVGTQSTEFLERFAILVAERALADSMREVQRLGQEIEQEPVDYKKLAALGWQAIECKICGGGAMGYPQRKPLTLHQIHKALISICYDGSAPTSTDDPEFVELIVPLARAIEAAHGIKEEKT